MTKIGQKTGTLKTSKNVIRKAVPVARVAHHQNLKKSLFSEFKELFYFYLEFIKSPYKRLKFSLLI